jgi:hypothetical protein
MTDDNVSVIAEPETPHNSALYEAGMKLLVDSESYSQLRV